MRFKKTRDVLAHVGNFHRAISARCDQLSGETDAKRLKLLLDYVSEREAQLADAVTVFTEKTPDRVLDTWFQYTSDDAPIQRLLDADMRPNMTADDLMRVIMEISDHFGTLYKDVAAAAETDEVRAVFQNLLQEQQKGKEKVARNFQMFADL